MFFVAVVSHRHGAERGHSEAKSLTFLFCCVEKRVFKKADVISVV